MKGSRALALAAPAAFGLLAALLAGIGAVPAIEATLAAASVALAFGPSGIMAPGTWRRRGAEALLLPAAVALTLIADPTMRALALGPLLLIAAWAAGAAAVRRTDPVRRALLISAAALAVRVATAAGLTGRPLLAAALAVLAPALLAAGLGRLLAARIALPLALLAGALPLERSPLVAGVLAAGGLAIWLLAGDRPAELPSGWAPGAVGVGLVAASLAPWGGILPWPPAGVAATASAGALLSFALPAGPAGAVWLAATWLLGPALPPPPDRGGAQLTAQAPTLSLPPGDGRPYTVDLSLANAISLPAGTPVATLDVAGQSLVLRAGEHAAEWALARPGAVAGHSFPEATVWRPARPGAGWWAVSGRVRLEVPAGVAPNLERERSLPPGIVVAVADAGPARPTPPRDWPLPAWLLAAAVVVVLLQAASGTWRSAAAAVAWAPLIAGSLAARLPVEPFHLLAERHAVDLALAALLAAWLPAARVWLPRGRVFLAAAALLVPLAAATPRLTPPMYGDEPFHLIVMRSLAEDRDLDLANNYDLERHPINRIYFEGDVFLHSPVLGTLLLPAYLLASRTGALLVLALAAAGVVALIARRARALGCPTTRVPLLSSLLLLSYPLAVFAQQIWAEVPGALAASAALALAAGAHPLGAAGVAALAATVKLRLALVVFPIAAAAFWRPRLDARTLRRATLGLGLAAAAGLAVTWAALGHPLGYRRLAWLIPSDLGLAVRVVGGLLFDAAAGLAWSAPLILLALVGVRRLARRGGAGERGLIVGAVLTLAALLHSPEWYGGGAPPARYLVPLLPLAALSGAMLLRGPSRARRFAWPLLAPALGVWWVLVSRPHFSINPGNGGWWLADALARRFAADARDLFPSFLRLSPATWLVPVVLLALALGAGLATRFGAGARLARSSAALWMAAAMVVVGVLLARTDSAVELESPQVRAHGGRPEPPPGTFARYSHPNGWRLTDGDELEVPLNLQPGARVAVEGWLEGRAQEGAGLEAAWNGVPAGTAMAAGAAPGRVPLPNPPGPGRQRLRLRVVAPAGGEVVLDRVVVDR